MFRRFINKYAEIGQYVCIHIYVYGSLIVNVYDYIKDLSIMYLSQLCSLKMTGLAVHMLIRDTKQETS